MRCERSNSLHARECAAQYWCKNEVVCNVSTELTVPTGSGKPAHIYIPPIRPQFVVLLYHQELSLKYMSVGSYYTYPQLRKSWASGLKRPHSL